MHFLNIFTQQFACLPAYNYAVEFFPHSPLTKQIKNVIITILGIVCINCTLCGGLLPSLWTHDVQVYDWHNFCDSFESNSSFLCYA